MNKITTFIAASFILFSGNAYAERGVPGPMIPVEFPPKVDISEMGTLAADPPRAEWKEMELPELPPEREELINGTKEKVILADEKEGDYPRMPDTELIDFTGSGEVAGDVPPHDLKKDGHLIEVKWKDGIILSLDAEERPPERDDQKLIDKDMFLIQLAAQDQQEERARDDA